MDKIKRARIKELEEPDEFITTSQKALNYAVENKTKILSIAGAVFGLFLIVSVVSWMNNKSETDAAAAQGKVMARYAKLVRKDGPEKAFKAASALFQEVMDDHSGTVGGTLAMVQYADLCYKEGDYDRAIPLYEKALPEFAGDAAVKSVLLASLGHSHAAKKELSEAARLFEELKAEPGKLMKDEALFNLGLIYDAMGKTDKSREAFNSLIENHADSVYIEQAREMVAG